MEAINIDLLTSLINQGHCYSQVMSCLKQINETCNLDLKYMKVDAILTTALRINTRGLGEKALNQKETSDELVINWSFGQFKIFLWVIIYQCLKHSIQITNIDEKTTQEIQDIFPLKTPQFIRYEIRMLNTSKNTQMGSWSKEETKYLEAVMENYAKKGRSCDGINWRWVSYRIFTQSNCKIFRNLNHCREKWNNHLNPTVKRDRWTPEEDVRLFQLVEEYGHKWSKISKIMEDTRTEHMVKNRYNRFMRIWKIAKNSTSIDRSTFVQRIKDHYGIVMSERDYDLGVKVEENSYEYSEEPISQKAPEKEVNEWNCKEVVVKEEAVIEPAVMVEEGSVNEQVLVKEEPSQGGSQPRQSKVKQSRIYSHPYYISHIPAFALPPMFPFIH